MLFVCDSKILHKHCFQFLLELKWPQEKLKTMFMQNLGWQTKSIMVCYGIFWSGQLHYCDVIAHPRYIKILLKLQMFHNSDPLSRNSQKRLEHKEDQTKYRKMTKA